MRIHLNDKVKFIIISFVIAFIAVMSLFIWKPDIVRSKNKYVRAFFAFAIVFIPGVMGASICAVTITTVWNKLFASRTEKIIMEAEKTTEGAEEKATKKI
jgi:hypothetical protein